MRMNKKELSENGKNSCKAEGTMQEPSKKIFTIPNLLSMVRILLPPVFVWLYSVKKEYMAAFVVLLLSGVTDLLDGFIARRFHMISVLGKMLDPIADKLTQAAVLLSLGSRFPLLFVLAALFVLKEAVTGVMFLVVMRKTQAVRGADWHGKITTFLLDATMLIHILWFAIPLWVSHLLTGLCAAVMLMSFLLYFRENLAAIRKTRIC